eukprot:g3982.t1
MRGALLRNVVAVSKGIWSSRGVANASQLTAIKRLRDRSGAPLGDVKKALEEANYNFDAAYDALRLKGLAAAAKKASRIATDGLVGVVVKSQRAAIVEVIVHRSGNNSALSDDWRELKTEEYLNSQLASTGRTLEESAAELSGTIREKINLRRAYCVSTTGSLFSYCHNPPPSDVNGLGKIGCLISLESSNQTPLSSKTMELLNESGFGSKLAMHVAGMKPLYLDKASVDLEKLEHEMKLLRQQALESGKPEAIVDRIVHGRMQKFYEEFCLLQQPFLMDEEQTVSQQLSLFMKDNNLIDTIIISAFLRLVVLERMMSETQPTFTTDDPHHVSPELPSSAGSLGSRISSHLAPATDTLESSLVAQQQKDTVNKARDGASGHFLLLQEFKDLLRQYIGVKGCKNASRFELVANPKANENRRGPPSQSSIYRGVTRHMRTRKWEAHIWQRKQLYLGGFEDVVDAAKAHDVMSLKLKQEAAVTNFMRDSYQPLLPYINRLPWESIMSALRQCTKGSSFSRLENYSSNEPGSLAPGGRELHHRLEDVLVKPSRRATPDVNHSLLKHRSLPTPLNIPSVTHPTGLPQAYAEYLNSWSNSIDTGQSTGLPFFDNTGRRMSDRGLQSYLANPLQHQGLPTQHSFYPGYNMSHGLENEHLQQYLDAASVPSAPDVQILPGRVIGDVTKPESNCDLVTQQSAVQDFTSKNQIANGTEPVSNSSALVPENPSILRNCELGSSGSSNDLDMKAAIRAVAGYDDYEIGPIDFLSDPTPFDQPWPPYW